MAEQEQIENGFEIDDTHFPEAKHTFPSTLPVPECVLQGEGELIKKYPNMNHTVAQAQAEKEEERGVKIPLSCGGNFSMDKMWGISAYAAENAMSHIFGNTDSGSGAGTADQSTPSTPSEDIELGHIHRIRAFSEDLTKPTINGFVLSSRANEMTEAEVEAEEAKLAEYEKMAKLLDEKRKLEYEKLAELATREREEEEEFELVPFSDMEEEYEDEDEDDWEIID